MRDTMVYHGLVDTALFGCVGTGREGTKNNNITTARVATTNMSFQHVQTAAEKTYAGATAHLLVPWSPMVRHWPGVVVNYRCGGVMPCNLAGTIHCGTMWGLTILINL